VGKVTNITDGDTIHVVIDGVDYKIRYIGMDAPEQGAKGAAQATQFNSNLVLGKMVTLVKDVSETDRYDRLLRYVFVGDTFVNYELVANGLAHSGSWPPDTACDQVFAAAESRARLNQFGLWAPTFTPMPYVPPASTAVPFVPPLVEPTSPLGGGSSSCDPSYPDVCIAPPPPDLDCKDISYRNFRVLPPDPHNFDGNHDGYGCQS
jgi:micrococcal nuclease